MSDVLLRPEEFRYGRLRPPSRLPMNSLRSALTAALAGQNPWLSGRRRTTNELSRGTEHYNQADASANVRKTLDTTGHYPNRSDRLRFLVPRAFDSLSKLHLGTTLALQKIRGGSETQTHYIGIMKLADPIRTVNRSVWRVRRIDCVANDQQR